MRRFAWFLGVCFLLGWFLPWPIAIAIAVFVGPVLAVVFL